MEVIYAAYGLQLVSSFPLPGLLPVPARDGVPSLALSLLEPAELTAVWRRAIEPPEWRGRQGDGRDLVIEREVGGDVLFSYGDLARFRLDPAMRHLDCAPSKAGSDWMRVLIGKVIPSISVMRGYEALHAAAVDSPSGVVAIMAPSGSGKSTLALELLCRGWPLFTDDVLALSRSGDTVSAHPGTAHMTVAVGHPEAADGETLGETLAILAGERWLAVRNVATHKRPIRLLCLLERGPDRELALESLRPSPLPLVPYTLGLSTEAARRRARFELYADLTASATLVRLTAGLDHRPSELADRIEQALTLEPLFLAGAPS